MASASKNRFWCSSIGMKFSMAVSGILLFGFVIAHLLGNLQIFEGPEKINSYAKFLRSIPGPLWTARIGLIVIVLVHIVSAFKLTATNRAARPEPYAYKTTVQAPWASLHMFDTGMLVLLFILFHLAHYTFGLVQPQFAHLTDAAGNPDVYTMVINGFRNPWYAAFYILAMCGIGFHLSHGIYSFFQTLGVTHAVIMPTVKRAAPLIGWAIAAAYIAIPVSVLAGILK